MTFFSSFVIGRATLAPTGTAVVTMWGSLRALNESPGATATRILTTFGSAPTRNTGTSSWVKPRGSAPAICASGVSRPLDAGSRRAFALPVRRVEPRVAASERRGHVEGVEAPEQLVA